MIQTNPNGDSRTPAPQYPYPAYRPSFPLSHAFREQHARGGDPSLAYPLLQKPWVNYCWGLYGIPVPDKTLIIRQPAFPTTAQGYSSALHGVEVPGNSSGYTDTTTQNGNTYSYKACPEYSVQWCSSVSSILVPNLSSSGTSTPMPTITNATIGDGTITITWNSVQSSNGPYDFYIVQWGQPPTPGILLPEQQVSGGTFTFTASGIQPDTTYLFGIDGCRNANLGTGSLCSGFGPNTSVYVPRGAPTNLSVVDQSQWTDAFTWTPKLHVSWQPGINYATDTLTWTAINPHQGDQWDESPIPKSQSTFDVTSALLPPAISLYPGTLYSLSLCADPSTINCAMAAVKTLLPSPKMPLDASALKSDIAGAFVISWETADNITDSFEVDRQDTIVVFKLHDGSMLESVWTPLKPVVNRTTAFAYSINDAPPSATATFTPGNTYRVCAQNASGSTCTLPFAVTVFGPPPRCPIGEVYCLRRSPPVCVPDKECLVQSPTPPHP